MDLLRPEPGLVGEERHGFFGGAIWNRNFVQKVAAGILLQMRIASGGNPLEELLRLLRLRLGRREDWVGISRGYRGRGIG